MDGRFEQFTRMNTGSCSYMTVIVRITTSTYFGILLYRANDLVCHWL